MLLVWLAAGASAQVCPDVPAQVEQAWAAFNDAELEHSKEIIAAANESLSCQTSLVPTEDLLALYRLDALVSLSQDDDKGAVGATLRAVATDHVDGAPPEAKYGPELAELYRSWADRMSGALVTIRVDGGGYAWVDGRRVDTLNPIQVVEGEHLVQLVIPDLIRSELVDLSADYIVYTGIPGVELPYPIPVPQPDPDPAVVPDPAPRVASTNRKRPAVLLIGGAASAILGGAAFATGFRSEQSFKANAYGAPHYDGCTRNQGCYAQARVDVINADAFKIRAAYGAGYAFTGVGVGLLGLGAVGLPADARMIRLGWRW